MLTRTRNRAVTKLKRSAFFAMLVVSLPLSAVSSEISPEQIPLPVAKVLNTYCFTCHDGDTMKGDIQLDNLDKLARDARLELLNKVQEQIYTLEMPPKKKDQPTSVERDGLLSWVAGELKRNNASKLEDKLRYYKYGNYISHEKLFSGEITDKPFTPARRWRINELIYLQLVNDVFQLNGKSRRYESDAFYGIVPPFNLPSDSGVKYYDTEILDGGAFLTLLSNAKWIAGKQLKPALVKHGLYVYPEGYEETMQKIRDRKKGERGPRISGLYPDETWDIKQTKAEFEQIIQNKSKPNQAELEAAIAAQYKLALQRPPTQEESARYLSLFEEAFKLGSNNTMALERVLVSILMEPDFVYRKEFGDGRPDADGRMKLTPREASYAIAYALTDSTPDEQLTQAANSGKLVSKEDYKREVVRLLNDDTVDKPRIIRFFQDFFGYYNIFNVFKDEDRFVGNYGPHRVFSRKYIYRVPGKVSKEADAFVSHILKEDKDVFNRLLTSDKYFVHHNGDNKSMAVRAKAAAEQDRANREEYLQLIEKKNKKEHLDPKQRKNFELYEVIYGKDGTTGKSRVAMPNDGEATAHSIKMYNLDYRTWSYEIEQPFKVNNRMGMLTHPAWLVSFSQNAATDPIHRGKWIREKLLAGIVPDVPITVDAQIPEDPHRTLRERMVKTEDSKCWNCHQRMNPLGYAFECFDDFGRYRTEEALESEENIIKTEKVLERGRNGPYSTWTVHTYKTKPIVTNGVLDGTGDKSLDGDVKDALDLITRLGKSERVRQSFIRNVFRYFMGRNEMLSDSQTLIAADKAYVESGGSFKALVESLLTSDSFIYRKNLKD